jgi:regulator of PEP synthase PpsR (kinase-PPPase family)
MSSEKSRIKVHVVSDATGITAERVISAGLVQFENKIEPIIERHAFVQDPARMGLILDEMEKEDAILIYSLVKPELRAWTRREIRRRDLQGTDLMGPLLAMMTAKLGAIPLLHPGLLGDVGDASMRLAESIEFTLKHDDGQEVDTLNKSDVVILGASRCSKTPTSLYLSCNYNLKVSNVPLIQEHKPPENLFHLTKPYMVGLSIDPGKLANIRKNRYPGQDLGGYTDMHSIWAELAFCQEVYKKIPKINIMDVSNSSIEEVASSIVRDMQEEMQP